jgi:hypothetical protein
VFGEKKKVRERLLSLVIVSFGPVTLLLRKSKENKVIRKRQDTVLSRKGRRHSISLDPMVKRKE